MDVRRMAGRELHVIEPEQQHDPDDEEVIEIVQPNIAATVPWHVIDISETGEGNELGDIPNYDQGTKEAATSSVATKDVTALQCPVCLENLLKLPPGQTTLATACGHLFCSACLPRALSSSASCPTCRANLRGKPPTKIFL